MLGDFWCSGEEITRISDNPSAWFDGTLISLYAELRVKNAQQRFQNNVHHLPTTVMTWVACIMTAQKEGDRQPLKGLRDLIAQALERVSYSLLPFSSRALMVLHVILS